MICITFVFVYGFIPSLSQDLSNICNRTGMICTHPDLSKPGNISNGKCYQDYIFVRLRSISFLHV